MLSKFGRSRRKKQVHVEVIHDGLTTAALKKSFLPVLTIESARERTTRLMKGRIVLSACLFALVFAAYILRLGEVTLGHYDPQPSTRVVAFSEPVKAKIARAELVDRNGNRLAMNATTIGLAINSRNVWDAAETAAGVTSVFPELDEKQLAQRIEKKKYLFIKGEISAWERDRLTELGLPGLEFINGHKRVYPQGDLGAHLVGQVIPGKGGVMGLEGAIDRLDMSGTVVTSIDISAQQILEEELAKAMALYQAKAAWGVILSAKNGEVVALASLPDFNPNAPGETGADARRNRAMYDRYELGSAFKPITAAAALEEGVATLNSLYDVRYKLKVGDREISDFTPKGHELSFFEVLQYSSNIGVARMAAALGAEKQKQYLKALNMLDPLVTELPERRAPAYPAHWGPVEVATIAYGHGIAVTPLQLAAAFAPVINGGIYHEPTFLKGGDASHSGRRVFSPQTSASMRIALRRVVTDGTSRRAEAPGYYPIGKTATADKPSKEGGYRKDARLSSFIGAFPGYDPEFVILVSLDEPLPTKETRGWATAGFVAAPVFQNIVSRLGPVFGLNPVQDERAFAGFMAEFRNPDGGKMAMNDAGFAGSDVLDDPLAALLVELGP